MATTYFPERYTNANETTVAVGGIAAGETFSVESPADVFNRMFYPYQSPTFSAFATASPIEVGDIVMHPTFTWATTNTANVHSGTPISIADITNAGTVTSGVANSSPWQSLYGPIFKATGNSSVQFRITGIDTQNATFYKDAYVYWYWRRYYGESADETLTASTIKTLRVNELAASGARTYSFSPASGCYKWIASAYELTTFKDSNTGLPASMKMDCGTVSVTNNTLPHIVDHPQTTNYYIYRSNEILNSAVTIIAS